MFKRTSDNRLVYDNGKSEAEILPYFNLESLFQLKKELLLIEEIYQKEVFGGCVWIFLTKAEYQVLKLQGRRYSLAAMAKKLDLEEATVKKILQDLKQKYKLWAHDEKFKPNLTVEMSKVYVNEVNFSTILAGEDFAEMAAILPNDGGWESAAAWSKIAAIDILNNLTPIQKQTAILLEQGYKPEEIGKKLKVSTQEVYQKIARMRKKLLKNGYGNNLAAKTGHKDAPKPLPA